VWGGGRVRGEARFDRCGIWFINGFRGHAGALERSWRGHGSDVWLRFRLVEERVDVVSVLLRLDCLIFPVLLLVLWFDLHLRMTVVISAWDFCAEILDAIIFIPSCNPPPCTSSP
jgi:hypothetical protein